MLCFFSVCLASRGIMRSICFQEVGCHHVSISGTLRLHSCSAKVVFSHIAVQSKSEYWTFFFLFFKILCCPPSNSKGQARRFYSSMWLTSFPAELRKRYKANSNRIFSGFSCAAVTLPWSLSSIIPCVRECVWRHTDSTISVIMMCLGYDRALTRHMRVRVSVSHAGTQCVISCWCLRAGATGDKRTDKTRKNGHIVSQNTIHNP